MFEFPPYRLDPRAGRLYRGGQPVPLRPKAWALLRYLAERPGVLITKDEIHAAVWGDVIVSDDTLTRTLAELRRALGDDARTPRIIETVHRRGFRFIGRPHESGEASASRVEAEPAPEPSGATLVGRKTELATLWGLFRKASAGQRQVVFVEGEAGIGKSALVEAFLHAVRASGDAVPIGYGQCVEQYGEREPYMPVLEALERLGRGPARERLLPVVRSVAPGWLAQVPALQTPADAEQLQRWHRDTTAQRMLREFAGLLEAIASDHPVVLVLEDLHWADQGTVDLVSVLAQRPEPARLMMLGTLRPAQALVLDHPIHQVLTLLRARRRCAEVALEYLSRNDVARYLHRRLGGDRVADEVTAVVHERTDGNPLFMVVLVDHLLARGWLAEAGGAWGLTVPGPSVEQDLPDDLRKMIEGQLRLVAPAGQDVLEAAAVAGVAFDVPAVAAGLGGALDAVDSICHRLSAEHSCLRYLGDREWPDGTLAARYAFAHTLYQVTLYGRISASRRAAMHQRIGTRLEAGYAGRTAEISSELARHFQAGRDPRRALVHLEQAARRGYERHAYRDVRTCLEPALRLLHDLPDTPERRRDELRLLRLYGVVLSQTAGYAAEALLENLERTQKLCEQLADPAALFDVLSELCLFHSSSGRLVRADAIGSQLAELAEALDASAALQGCYLQGGVALWRGNLAAAEGLLARTLASPVPFEEADRPYGVNPVVGARSLEGLRRWVAGDPAGARAVQQEALTLAERHRRPFIVAQAATFGALVLALDDHWAEAGQLAARAVALSTEYGFPRWHGTALVVRGGALVEEGDGARGLAEIHAGLDDLERTGLRLGNSLLVSLLAGACLRLGRVDEGLAAAAAGLVHCRDTGERVFEAELWRLRGELTRRHAHATRRARPGSATLEAEEYFQKARAIAQAQGARGLEQRIGPTAAGRRPSR